jgi:hypothetical protein
MRNLNKYKLYTNTNLLLNNPSQRIFKFKRPKWKKLQTLLKKETTFLKKFVDNSVLKVKYKFWEKIQTNYRDGLYIKNSLSKLYDTFISTAYYKGFLKTKSKKQYKKIFLHCFIKPLFFINIILWKLNFYRSAFESKQALNYNDILLNNKRISHNITLKAGDIISIKKVSLIDFKNITPEFLFSFIEIDYYTNTIIVLKNIEDLNFDDISFLIKDSIHIKKFIDYINTK